MASILDQKKQEEEQKLASLRTKGIHVTPGTGPAEMTYKPIEQRTAAEARALGISPKVQGQIAQEQGLIQPQAPIAQPARQAVQPMPQATQQSPYSYAQPPSVSQVNSQLGMARGQIGANAAQGVRRLTDMVAQVDPRIRDDANARREWRMMTPQQRKEHIGLKKLEMDARDAESAAAGATWEDIDKTSRSFADATGTAMDSYGNSFYTPDQQMFIREQRRNIDRAAGELFSNADRSSWQNPQDMYQAIASLPEVQAAGPFGQAYAFNIMRRFATPQMRAQMEAEDSNQKLFRDWMVSRGAEEIANAQEQNGGFKFTNDGTGDIATQIALNRDNDLASGQIWRQFLSETPQIYTAMDGKVVVDQAHAAKFNEAARQKETTEQRAFAETQAKQKQAEQLAQKEQAAQETIRMRDEANPIQRGRFKINPVSKEIEDTYQYTQTDIAKLPEDERVKRSSELLQEISSWSKLLPLENETDETIAKQIEELKAKTLSPNAEEANEARASIANLSANWLLFKSMGGAEEIKYEVESMKRLRNKYKGVQ